MAAPTHREGDLARVDELRRRLYRPDATEEDRRDYAALIATIDPVRGTPLEQAPDAEEPDAVPVPPRRRRRVVVLGVAGGVLALVAAAAVVQQTAAPTLLLPAVPTAAATIGPPPDEPVVQLAAEGAVGLRFRGRGSGTAPIDPSRIGTPGGRLDVMITTDVAAPVHWTARRVEIHLDGDQYVLVLDEHTATQAGAIPSTYRFDGTPPTSIRVQVPTGVAWSMVVVPHR